MDTRFILHGGYAGRVNSENDKFFREILKGAPQNTKILLVYFAKEKDEYRRAREEDIAQFERNKGGRSVSFDIASAKIFLRQIKQSDVIYLHGGNTLKLFETLKKYPNLRNVVDGKTIAGESAGVYVLSSCFYSKTNGGIFEGLGFVPVKTICHYVGKNKEKLRECSEGLETLLLADHQYKVFQQKKF